MKYLALLLSLFALTVTAADFLVYPQKVIAGNCASTPGCPGGYCWYLSYTNANNFSVNHGWWRFDTNDTTHTATVLDTNNTKVQFGGNFGDAGCGPVFVAIPAPAFSQGYRFAQYGTNMPLPDTNHPIFLHGFLP